MTEPAGTTLAATVDVTVILAVRNEAANIRKCLEALSPAREVFVVDSGSTDGTAEIADQLGAHVVQFQYQGGYPKKRQWALDNLKIQTRWVLLLDADEEVPDSLWQEIQAATNRDDHAGYFIRKGFYFMGQRFRFGGFSFDAVLLFRHGKARFEHLVDEDASAMDMEVHERVIVDGTIGRLDTPLIHDDYKGLEAYLARHNRYSSWEASLRHRFFQTGQWGSESVRANLFGNTQERRRALKLMVCRMPLEPWIWFFYHYIVRGGFLEGRRGLIACRIRSSYIADVRAKVFELAHPRASR